jgi:hypothetical protein
MCHQKAGWSSQVIEPYQELILDPAIGRPGTQHNDSLLSLDKSKPIILRTCMILIPEAMTTVFITTLSKRKGFLNIHKIDHLAYLTVRSLAHRASLW